MATRSSSTEKTWRPNDGDRLRGTTRRPGYEYPDSSRSSVSALPTSSLTRLPTRPSCTHPRVSVSKRVQDIDLPLSTPEV